MCLFFFLHPYTINSASCGGVFPLFFLGGLILVETISESSVDCGTTFFFFMPNLLCQVACSPRFPCLFGQLPFWHAKKQSNVFSVFDPSFFWFYGNLFRVFL